MLIEDQNEKRLLIKRMNEEMRAIANSPSREVEKFRIGLLAKLAGELFTVNDRLRWNSCHGGRVS